MDRRLRTSRYSEPAVRDTELIPIGITSGRPRYRLKYHCEFWKTPAPGWAMMRAEGTEEGFTKAYVKMLDGIGIDRLNEELDAILGESPGGVLLCYEDLTKPDTYCHRRIFAEWYERQTGIEIPELEPLEEQARLL